MGCARMDGGWAEQTACIVLNECNSTEASEESGEAVAFYHNPNLPFRCTSKCSYNTT